MNFSVFPVAFLSFSLSTIAFAGSATWSSNPTSGDWNTAANWVPNTVPDGPTDIATFGTSNITRLSVPYGSIIEVDKIDFSSGAPPYTISIEVSNLFLSGAGIVNSSGSVQSFVTPITQDNNGAVFLFNSATAGEMTSFGGEGGLFVLHDSSSAGSAIFEVTSSGAFQAAMSFWESTTAANATINASNSAIVGLYDNSTAGNAVFTITSGATLFIDYTADHATATCIGGKGIYDSSIQFEGGSAGEGHFTAIGGTTSGEAGSNIEFEGGADAANGTFVIDGGGASELAGASLTFFDSSTANNATITANGGVNGAQGGAIIFQDLAVGGTASISVFGNGELRIRNTRLAGITIGSLTGDGLVLLGSKTLTVGSNNQSTTFSGVIHNTGSLIKTGTGTLTLTGGNTFTGGTTINGGALKTGTTIGSATGTGPVILNAGNLGGQGTIAGPVTIGSGTGPGAILAPGVGSSGPRRLTLQSSLTFKADGDYACQLNTKRGRADAVVANGVVLENGAQFAFGLIGNKPLNLGKVFTILSNTSKNPISGTFSNLADGSILTDGKNRYQVSYSGGDGNDLTLTVVP